MGQAVDMGTMKSVGAYLPLISAAMLFGIGLFVLSRNREAAVNRLFAAGMLSLAVGDAAWFASVHASEPSLMLLWQRVILAAHLVMLPAWYVFTASFGAADFREGIRRQRLVIWGIGVMSLFFLCLVPTASVIQDVLVRDNGGISFPLGPAGRIILVVSLALSMAVLSNLEATYRHAGRETRSQIKFLVLGFFGILGFHIFWISRTLLHAAIVPDSFRAEGFIHVIAGVLVMLSLAQHRLLHVDVFVSRYVVYRSLTLVLVGTYLFLLGTGREAVRLLGLHLGEWASAALLVGASLPLAFLLLSEGFQRRVKIFIDRHFYSHKYDYRREWISLTERLARAVAVHEVVPPIVEGVFETMWTSRAGIFLVESDKTRLRLAHGIGFGPDEQVLSVDPAVLDYMAGHPEPVDVEMAGSRRLAQAAAGLLDAWRKRGVRIATPMVARDEVLGFLVVGPDPSGQAFRPDDYDLCRTVAAQAATVIMNARMAEDLAHGREIRAFAEMSSFVIHDIKNCANILALVASNAEARIGNPAFQKDAIGAIRRSVEKMQALLQRLAGVRKPILRREPVDLNALVRDSLHALAGGVPGNARLETTLGRVPPLFCDPEQLEGVIRNLVTNAIEAVDGNGEIRIETLCEGEQAVLVVSDNGCGMSPEFVRDSLFRPFQSTKGGLGIGLYQCKQVAEAHGGRLDIQSAQGRGTTCVLRLPAGDETGWPETADRAALQGQAIS